jgi:type VI secretion system protein ImpA
MPLRDDLLDPIAGQDPSGPDLRYDPLFDRIQEARREEDDTLPTGDWDRPAKKADHKLVVKLAGEALAKRSKDLRLATFLIESAFKLEGIAVLAPSIELLRTLQQGFWETLHPEIEDGDLELRSVEVERLTRRLVPILQEIPLTASGLTAAKYRESRTVGYEADATTNDRRESRAAAIKAKKMIAEEFDKAAADTPKAFFVETKATLDDADEQIQQLDSFQREAYGEQYPQLSPLRAALEEARGLINTLLAERRKIEPDPVPASENILQDESAPPGTDSAVASHAAPLPLASLPAGGLSRTQDAYALIVQSAQFLFENDERSPVPYLVCAGLRLGETRTQGPTPQPGFAVGPSYEVRQSLRTLAMQGAWTNLLRAALPVMADPCARAWLDLHRYIWRAARESGAAPIAAAVSSTLRGLLTDRPEVRHWTLEDDTGAANPETQAWIDAEVLAPARG